MNIRLVILIGIGCLGLLGCKPADAPPDLVKTQRNALDQAKAVEGQLQQSREYLRAAEEQSQK